VRSAVAVILETEGVTIAVAEIKCDTPTNDQSSLLDHLCNMVYTKDYR
jgi:hypothetical protein